MKLNVEVPIRGVEVGVQLLGSIISDINANPELIKKHRLTFEDMVKVEQFKSELVMAITKWATPVGDRQFAGI